MKIFNFTEPLKTIDLTNIYDIISGKGDFSDERTISVKYEDGIPLEEQIPGLIDVVKYESFYIWNELKELKYDLPKVIPNIILTNWDLTEFEDKERYKKRLVGAEAIKNIEKTKNFTEEEIENKVSEIKRFNRLNKTVLIEKTKSMFFPKENVVRISYITINKKSDEEYYIDLRFSLYQAIFKAFHYSISNKQFEKVGYDKEYVVESLAEYYSFYKFKNKKNFEKELLLDILSINYANEKRKLWVSRMVIDWPNKYAIKLLDNPNKPTITTRFINVLKESTSNMDRAYEMLKR